METLRRLFRLNNNKKIIQTDREGGDKLFKVCAPERAETGPRIRTNARHELKRYNSRSRINEIIENKF